MLEQDQDPTVNVRPPVTTWDLPNYFNKLVSRSCVSLGDSHQVNTNSTKTKHRGNKGSTTVGWGSASCLNCSRNDVQTKPANSRSCNAGIKNHQSSLVTLLNLAVDSCGYETIYQLVDRSLLLVEEDVDIRGTVSMAQTFVEESADINSSQESDDESASQEVIVSFQWWNLYSTVKQMVQSSNYSGRKPSGIAISS